ncbi:MAG: enoyl-CoA hydratase/isomerase family protein [Dehalococcoidales bacterium]|nr:enoyl-CoA hydratase/isomerase family protein [Dehalococcoidales bacterium]
MPYSTVIYTKKDHIAHIALNRPEAGNSINLKLAQELGDICRQINQDEDIYVVVLTGAGDKAFCKGSQPEKSGTIYSAATATAGIEKPVIAAINGDALGQGLELALSCDIRLASDKANFGFPQVAQGLIPFDGGTQRLPRIVGRGKALELILTAETITAQEAVEIGLVSKVVGGANLAAEAEALARTIAGKGPIALRYIKEAVNKGLDLTLEQGLHLEADLYFLLHTTADRTEGITAFIKKRPPKFKGK